MKKDIIVMTTGAKIEEVLRKSGFPADKYEKHLKKFLKKLYEVEAEPKKLNLVEWQKETAKARKKLENAGYKTSETSFHAELISVYEWIPKTGYREYYFKSYMEAADHLLK